MKTLVTMTFVVLASASAHADPPNLFAYEGTLMLDNQQVPNGVRPVTFELYANAEGGVRLFTETQDVTFVNGRFSVLLGNPPPPASPIDPAIFNVPEVFIGIRIGDTALAGRQRIVPVPYGLWTARAENLDVMRGLTVGGNARVIGDLSVNRDMDVSGGVTLDGPILEVTSDVFLRGDTNMTGTTRLRGPTTVDGDASVGGAVVAASARVAGDVNAGAVVLGPRRIRGLSYSGYVSAIGVFPNNGATEIRSGGRAVTPETGYCALAVVDMARGRGTCYVDLSEEGSWWIYAGPSEGTIICFASCLLWD